MTQTSADNAVDIRIVPTREFAAAAADLVSETLSAKPDAVLGLPTGNTPMPLYKELLARAGRRAIDLSRARVAVLDDFWGIPADSAISFYGWLRRALLDPAKIERERVLRMPTEGDAAEQCAAYERALKAMGGCDLQLLGLGSNGHIGFNEPGSERNSRTRVVKLTASSRAASASYWKGARVPEFGVTTGVATILEARRIVLLVNGTAKAEILRRTLEGPITSEVPASFLREGKNVAVVSDHPAASQLQR